MLLLSTTATLFTMVLIGSLPLIILTIFIKEKD